MRLTSLRFYPASGTFRKRGLSEIVPSAQDIIEALTQLRSYRQKSSRPPVVCAQTEISLRTAMVRTSCDIVVLLKQTFIYCFEWRIKPYCESNKDTAKKVKMTHKHRIADISSNMF
ncbi:hypothetical protein TcasGA2_TC001005 [Tribolium castaneum]|uniref:Uncharacterized protein n=1 Tax=Tribolium castaneum TaxID=7070 RepID=D6W9K0_TRICA|nr:hypothetical protein TcasGA2_TC001005 [Tribolium castaneum]